jgi:hypothetical protein
MRGRHFLGLIVLTLIILMAMALIGCGGGNNTRLDVAAGQLVVTPSAFDFGKVAVGQEATRIGTLHAGNASITVTSADWSGEGFSLSGIAFPVTVAAGQSVPFKVTFAPQRNGGSSGKISFLSDAENSPHSESLRANAAQGEAASHSVSLAWRAGNSNTISYNIYRGVSSSGPYSKINSSPHSQPTFTDASVQGGQTYFYVTTALNKKGKESRHSNQIQVTIPNS